MPRKFKSKNVTAHYNLRNKTVNWILIIRCNITPSIQYHPVHIKISLLVLARFFQQFNFTKCKYCELKGCVVWTWTTEKTGLEPRARFLVEQDEEASSGNEWNGWNIVANREYPVLLHQLLWKHLDVKTTLTRTPPTFFREMRSKMKTIRVSIYEHPPSWLEVTRSKFQLIDKNNAKWIWIKVQQKWHKAASNWHL